MTTRSAARVEVVRLPERLRSPVRLGTVLLLGLLAALLAGQAALGRTPFGPQGMLADLLVAALHCALLAYLCAAYLGIVRSAARVLAAVGPGLPSPVPAADLLRLPPVGRPTAGWYVAALAGVALALGGPWLTEPDLMAPLQFWDPRGWAPETVWHRVLGVAIGVWLGWFAYAVFRVSTRVSGLARRLSRVDLFAPRELEPFAQQGLTNALATAGLLSLASLFALDTGLTLLLLGLWSLTAALVVVALLLPVVGVHRRLRAEKRAELAWCEARIRRGRERLRAGGEGGARGELADALAYRALVQEAPEWPFDTPALRRIALYLLVPLGSLLASALAQSLLERLIFAG